MSSSIACILWDTDLSSILLLLDATTTPGKRKVSMQYITDGLESDGEVTRTCGQL
jgi:hypothetical protein